MKKKSRMKKSSHRPERSSKSSVPSEMNFMKSLLPKMKPKNGLKAKKPQKSTKTPSI